MNKQKYLLDSCVLTAFFNPFDNQHKKAIKLMNKLSQKDIVLILHSLVIIETLSVLKIKTDNKALIFCENELLNEEKFKLSEDKILISQNSDPLMLFNKHKYLSLIDCILVNICLQENIKLLTFDQKLNKAYQKEKNN